MDLSILKILICYKKKCHNPKLNYILWDPIIRIEDPNRTRYATYLLTLLPSSPFLLRQRRWSTAAADVSAVAMSGGIARGRLSEERKAWRKSHPHVRPLLPSKSSKTAIFFIFNS